MCQLLRAGPGGRVTRLLVTFLGSQHDKPRLFLVATNRVHVNIAVIINAIVLYKLVFMYLLEIKLLLHYSYTWPSPAVCLPELGQFAMEVGLTSLSTYGPV